MNEYGILDLSRYLNDEKERKEEAEARSRAVADRRRSLRPVFEQLGSWGWVRPSWGSEDLFHDGGIWQSQADADAYFLREYRKNRRRRLKQLFTDMRRYPILSPRAELLDQIDCSMRKGAFLICVPALVTVLEGVLLEYVGLLATPTVRVIAAVDSIVMKVEPQEDYEILNWLGWLGIQRFIRALFEAWRFDQEPPKRANRHWIMHGRLLPTTGEVECLQLLQAIDAIAMDHYYAGA